MWRWAKGFGYFTAVLAIGCGGRIDGGSKDPGENQPSKTPTPSSPASSHPPTDNPDADTELGACVRGPLEYAEPYQPCAWVADNRCYDTREMACNCACPRSHDSQCASGFDGGPDGHVWVSCD
jgi:hypothetical protein